MKKVLLAIVLFVSITAMAQEKKAPAKKLTTEQKVDFQVKRLTKDLDLNETQVKELRALVTKEVEKREAKIAEMKQKKEQNKEARIAEHKEQQAAFAADMKKILTPEQFTKWEKSREENKSKMKERIMERRGKSDLEPIKE
jgi:hypothetical protein